MKAEQIEQIVSATDSLIAQSISDAVAEQFKKRSKPAVNINLIIGIIGLVVVGLMAFFVVAATNNNADDIKDTITESVGAQNAAIVGLAETIENGDADIIAGIDGVQTSITGLQGSVDAVKEQNTKIQDKVQSLSQMTANASATQIRKFEKCMVNRQVNFATSTVRDNLLWCKHHLG